MKIRQGFVSNSSSSSFIITEKKAKTAQVALSMIRLIEKDYLENDRESSKWFAKAEEWLLNNIDYDDPIVIPWSCNYETWLSHVRNHKLYPNGIYIATCNNHPWWDLEDYNPFFQKDDDFHYAYLRTLADVEFFDLTTFEKVKKSEFVYLWERTRKNENP